MGVMLCIVCVHAKQLRFCYVVAEMKILRHWPRDRGSSHHHTVAKSTFHRQMKVLRRGEETEAKPWQSFKHISMRHLKKCVDYEVESATPRDRPKKTCREIVEKDCKARGLNTIACTKCDHCKEALMCSSQLPAIQADQELD